MSLVRNEIRKGPTIPIKILPKMDASVCHSQKANQTGWIYGRVPVPTHELEHVQFIMYRMILGSLSVFNNGISL